MLFIKFKGKWYELKNNRLYNYKGGWTTYDPTESETIEEGIELATWQELYAKTGYCPYQVDELLGEMWIAPNGKCFYGRAHSLCAEHIVDFLFCDDEMEFPEDFLISNGWIKTTTSAMGHLYAETGMYDHMTPAQFDIMREWTSKYGIRMDEKYFKVKW